MTDYRFIDKDPVIDVIRTEAQRKGNLGPQQLRLISYESGVSESTLRNWFNGDTKRPLSLSTRFVLEALGVNVVYQRDDGTSIRQPGLQMKSKTEQDKIRKRDRERGRNKDED